MKLYVKPENDALVEKYCNHSHYHEGDSGLDLFSPDTVVIPPGLGNVVDLKIKCEAFVDSHEDIDETNLNNQRHTSYTLNLRSSTALNTPLRLANSTGIIDAGYRGSIKAIFDNLGDSDYTINANSRLVQICGPMLEPITFGVVNSLSNTSRGEGGFGSTNTS
jgi:dUTP pyrophosphatase